MVQDLPIENFFIDYIANGYVVRVSYIDKKAHQDDRWSSEEFYFATVDEVLAFLETNLD